MNDDLGDRMKAYEYSSSTSLDTSLPIIARLDGRAFHTYTRLLGKAYNNEFVSAMNYAAILLHQRFHCQFSYVQSDEITLVLMPPQTAIFDGRVQKLSSVLAATGSVLFNEVCPKTTFTPVFDCRIYNVPDKCEVANSIYWRFIDCKRNSVSMIARDLFSHSECQYKNTAELTDMIIAFQNDLGISCKSLNQVYDSQRLYGTARKTRIESMLFSNEEIKRLPESHPAKLNPNLKFNRRQLSVVDFHLCENHQDRLNAIFA